MQEDKKKVETVLFTTGRFLGIDEISKMSGIASVGYLKEVIESLKSEYANREGALEIIQLGEKWKLNIKKEYLYLTETLLTDSELDKSTQETLAVIAYKNPAMQSEIIKIRGNGAYDHIKILKELDFVTTEITGRTRTIKLTQKFYDYFDVAENQLKSKMSEVSQKIELPVVPNQSTETVNLEENKVTTNESQNQ